VILLLLILASQEAPDLSTVAADLVAPAMIEGDPSPGKRVKQTTPGWEGTTVHHALYLPREWKADGRYPVLVEYAGNGGYRNSFGDVSHGTVEGSHLGFGITGGEKALWVCMPFVKKTDAKKENAVTWWGDVEETKAYCRRTVAFVCEKYGGDPKKVILAGFSRGAIGCNYIGLHDDEIASLWRGFITFSHYDGQRTTWGYAGADRNSALVRLKRLQGRPQFISMEKSVDDLRDYLKSTGIEAPFTFQAIRFRNHSDEWVLRDIPERRAVRDWLARVLKD
jgi:hypothetical protein